MATEPCPNCGHELNEAAIGCQDCGAKWSEDGEYLGVPAEDAARGTPASASRRVADMAPGELQATVFLAVFTGVLAATAILWLVGLALMAVFDYF